MFFSGYTWFWVSLYIHIYIYIWKWSAVIGITPLETNIELDNLAGCMVVGETVFFSVRKHMIKQLNLVVIPIFRQPTLVWLHFFKPRITWRGPSKAQPWQPEKQQVPIIQGSDTWKWQGFKKLSTLLNLYSGRKKTPIWHIVGNPTP